jgi:hypothetical protein
MTRNLHRHEQIALGRAEGRRLFRHSQGYELKRTVLIVGEGKETEPNYFRGLRGEQCVQNRFHVTVKGGIGRDALAAVNIAVGEMANRSFDEVYVVVDVEGPTHAESLRKAIELAKQRKIQLILSNPSIEVWFLAHFKRTSKFFADSKAAEEALATHWRKNFGGAYSKSDEHLYRRMKDRTSLAIEHAKSVHTVDHKGRSVVQSNSSTEVYQLVAHLLGQ